MSWARGYPIYPFPVPKVGSRIHPLHCSAGVTLGDLWAAGKEPSLHNPPIQSTPCDSQRRFSSPPSSESWAGEWWAHSLRRCPWPYI